MNYRQAKTKALLYQIFGNIIFLFSLVAISVSVLKALYYHFDSEPLLSGVSSLIKKLVNYIFEHTQFLGFIWEHSPIPHLISLFELSNLWFALIYFPLFIGAALVRYGRGLSRRLNKIDKQIQDEIFKNQLRGITTNEGEMRNLAEVNEGSFFYTQFHTLYVAPLIVGLIVYFIQKVFGN